MTALATAAPAMEEDTGGFVAWLAAILGTRRVPAAAVEITLDAFAAALYDFPRAQAHLAAGRRML